MKFTFKYSCDIIFDFFFYFYKCCVCMCIIALYIRIYMSLYIYISCVYVCNFYTGHQNTSWERLRWLFGKVWRLSEFKVVQQAPAFSQDLTCSFSTLYHAEAFSKPCVKSSFSQGKVMLSFYFCINFWIIIRKEQAVIMYVTWLLVKGWFDFKRVTVIFFCLERIAQCQILLPSPVLSKWVY